MVAKLASSTFLAGPQEDLATVDVYNQNGTKVINSIREDYSFDMKKGLDTLRGGLSMLNRAKNIVDAVKNLKNGNIANSMARVNAIAGSVTAGMRDMSALTQSGFSQSINGYIPQNQRIVAEIGGVRQALPQGLSFPDLKATTDMIVGVTGAAVAIKLHDPGALIGSMSAVVNQGMRMGLPDSFGTVMQGTAFGALSVGQIAQITQRSLPGVVRSSDLRSLASMARLNSPGTLRAMNPGVVTNVASSYRLPPNTPRTEYVTTYDTAMDAFDATDPKWNRGTWSGGEVANITALRDASPDMTRVIRTGAKRSTDPEQKMMLLADAYPSNGSVNEQLRRNFPNTVLGGSRQQSKTADARLPIYSSTDLGTVYPDGINTVEERRTADANYVWWKEGSSVKGVQKPWSEQKTDPQSANSTTLEFSDATKRFLQTRSNADYAVVEQELRDQRLSSDLAWKMQQDAKEMQHAEEQAGVPTKELSRYDWASQNGGISSRGVFAPKDVYLQGVRYTEDGGMFPASNDW